MAPSRRRTSRRGAPTTPKKESTAQPQRPPSSEPEESEEGTPSQTNVPERTAAEKCPACKDDETAPLDSEQDTWIRCDACKSWYHWRCVAEEGQDHETVDKWYCQSCRAADQTRVITFKPPARKSSRKRANRDYASLHAGLEAGPNKWLKIMEGKTILDDNFQRLKGSMLTMDWLHSNDTALREPVVIEKPEGLGMSMPPDEFEVKDVAEIVGENTPVEVIDVNTQSNVPNWNLAKWTEYYYSESRLRDKIRNVISLEISNTPLAAKVVPPRLVRELDWVEQFWPSGKRGKGHAYPKVQLYCLMGVAQAWTDWHIDFAGSSVYYHIFKGAKTFYFIRPTTHNLAAYEKWSGSETQNQVWLGDMVDEVVKVELHQGSTMIIPTGWIHAVYTPEDSLVFGGNFLHSYNVQTQLRVRDIEITTHVPKKFRFPFFTKLCWYVGEKYLRELKAKEDLPVRVLESIESLAQFLVNEARTMERGADPAQREAKDMVPTDKVKDPSALARELRWRVRIALGSGSGDEGKGKPKVLPHVNGTNKRKRDAKDVGVKNPVDAEPTIFKHFKPRHWDKELRHPGSVQTEKRQKGRPTLPLGEDWLEWKDSSPEVRGDDAEEAEVESRHDLTIRARSFEENGILYVERHWAERKLEIWKWPVTASSELTPDAGSAMEGIVDENSDLKDESN
ncbi:JmjC domain-containing histone demethylation protein 1 [Sistotremastrum niveocremeum HHB9708]|uniref:JmjC domain-containing histone demethylation protein 1 n=2 Tax=Sistotremastraceae TaxID=3402574 RepID=A0A165AN75_9AGAM|nr:JmjC domain-containing histone demethylation protein 1 [Sistotremastrum niveocremeum HHB9708]KZT36994.1 Clavaminate synthase-like protein [Sistotremastrum suecicum HHB10207 ss-3]